MIDELVRAAIEKAANELEVVDGDGTEARGGGGKPIFRST